MNLIILETKRLILKGLSPEDMKYIFNNLTKSEIKEILGHRSEEDYLKEEQKHQNGYSSYNRSFILFLMEDKESGKLIGRCGIHNWNMEHKRAEIGYVMEDESFKRKGLMTEALSAVIDYGFKEIKMNRIEALVGIGNIPSLRILENNNFKKEGILRQHFCIAGTFVDSILMSILSEEYESNMTAK